MISYYNSKHPGLYMYITLVSISALSFLFFEINTAHLGILSVLWGIFIFMRIISLYEAAEYFPPFTRVTAASKNTNYNSSALAYDLLRGMNNQSYIKRGKFALHAVSPRTLLWLVLALIYAGYNIYLSKNIMPSTTIMQNLSVFFMIGAGFWAGQTYAYSNYASKILFTVFTVIFVLALFKISGEIRVKPLEAFTGYKFDILNSGINPALIILMAYCLGTLLYSFTKGGTCSIYSLIGMILVATLSILGTTLEQSPQVTSLWISGWSLLSIFWIKSNCFTKKQYILYQCE